jgi:hypothetical protein
LSAAEVLSKAGFEQVSALRGGMESWNKAGYPSKGIRPGIVNDHQSTNRSPYRFYPQTDEMASMLGRVKEAKGFAADRSGGPVCFNRWGSPRGRTALLGTPIKPRISFSIREYRNHPCAAPNCPCTVHRAWATASGRDSLTTRYDRAADCAEQCPMGNASVS